ARSGLQKLRPSLGGFSCPINPVQAHPPLSSLGFPIGTPFFNQFLLSQECLSSQSKNDDQIGKTPLTPEAKPARTNDQPSQDGPPKSQTTAPENPKNDHEAANQTAEPEMPSFPTQTASEECPEALGCDQTPVDKTEAFDYYHPPNAPFGPWYTHPNAPKEPYQIVRDNEAIIIYPLIFNGKYNNPAAYLVHMKPPPTPTLTISTPPTSDATGQSSQFLGVFYLALTGLIDSALPAAGPWAVAGKALSYLVKLGPIIWWAMPVPVLTPPSSARALRYSWYPDIKLHSELSLSVLNLPSINSFSDSKVEINRIIDIKDIVTKLTKAVSSHPRTKIFFFPAFWKIGFKISFK
ncbi:hypothetical protein DSO57_1019527, partial [Entomophthora muscae]